ncbi:MAG: DUF3108 domain-containing protein [Acidobacteriota bacterium]
MNKYFLSLFLIFSPAIIFSPPTEAGEKPAASSTCCFNNFPFDQDFLLKNGEAETTRPPAPKITHPLPFQAGESLFYEVSFEKLIFSGKVGEMTLKTEPTANANTLQLKGEIVSKGFLTSLFKLNFEQTLSSLISTEDLSVIEAVKLIDDGKTRKQHTMKIDREKGRLKYVFKNLSEPDFAPQEKESTSPVWVQDILSIFYFTRTQELKEGTTLSFPVCDEGRIRNIEVLIGKREEVKVDAGKFKAIMIEAKIFGGLFLRRSGEMYIWFSDDARKLPVKTKLKLSNGTVNIELRKIQG